MKKLIKKTDNRFDTIEALKSDSCKCEACLCVVSVRARIEIVKENAEAKPHYYEQSFNGAQA